MKFDTAIKDSKCKYHNNIQYFSNPFLNIKPKKGRRQKFLNISWKVRRLFKIWAGPSEKGDYGNFDFFLFETFQ